jgi:hypothetical protein
MPVQQSDESIERVFGYLKRNFKLKSLKHRGLAGTAEEFTMPTATYDLQLLSNRARRPEHTVRSHDIANL